jgi:hypothetical protein
MEHDAMTAADYIAWAEALVAGGMPPAEARKLAVAEATAEGDLTPDLHAQLTATLFRPGLRAARLTGVRAFAANGWRAMKGHAETIRSRWSSRREPRPTRRTHARRTPARSPDRSA